jgi:hypothetical protein
MRPVAQSLFDAGALLAGKTNMHELAFGISTNNAYTGATRNPWHHDMIAGAAAVDRQPQWQPAWCLLLWALIQVHLCDCLRPCAVWWVSAQPWVGIRVLASSRFRIHAIPQAPLPVALKMLH